MCIRDRYRITGGVTFSFGGIQIDTNARILDTSENPIKGLYASGDVIGLLRQLNRKRSTLAGGADCENGRRSRLRPMSKLGSATVAREARTLNAMA